MKIALLTHSLRPRGGVIHTLELADALAARGHAVTVIAAAEPGEQPFRAVRHTLAVIRLPALAAELVTQVRQRIDCLTEALPSLLADGDFDIAHTQDSLGGNALASLREQGRLALPWLRTIHHLDVFEQPVLNAWQDRAWRRADGIACVSDDWLARLRAQAGGVPVERMFNGVDLRRYGPQPVPGDDERLAALGLAPDGGPVCLLVGGVEARKNTVRLLQAFAQLRREDPAWRASTLVIAGGASMLDHGAARRAWDEALQSLGLDEGPGRPVLRTGPLPDEALPALMRRAAVLAMPSLVEGFGLVALEALACGTPVLVSRRPPFTEHLADEPTVAWCEPEDVGSIAAGLREALGLPRPTAMPRVCIDHGWDRSARLHEDWYRRALIH
ncbi:MSMEG_0565 family glycosyltransferase [Paucibacter sp. R3-3]|uniref:MSMEG_0565 family glycosyltransferase n=1 Tax=Roseateles agri TaxID=3098619 RepID=A0ABU5DRK5_9BURK|nr:MSMEG_0565 family glycosyltransferase [Paucibacter sp. R3-3]MDY0748952.1 MSMEG_0565 family glycosyltransferase [Paucibacter sp. R3-3]